MSALKFRNPFPEHLHKRVMYLLLQDEPFCSNTALPGIDQTGRHCGISSLLKVCILQYDKRIAAPQLQDRFLYLCPGNRCNRCTCRGTARKGHRFHPGMFDNLLHFRRADCQVLKYMEFETRISKNLFNGCSTSLYIGCMLQQCRISGHECRRREPEHLPE